MVPYYQFNAINLICNLIPINKSWAFLKPGLFIESRDADHVKCMHMPQRQNVKVQESKFRVKINSSCDLIDQSLT